MNENNNEDILNVVEDNEEVTTDDNNTTETSVAKTKKPFYKRWYFILTAILVTIVLIFNHFATVVVIAGESMHPNFENGQVVIAKRQYDVWRFDVVTIESKEAKKILIKRVIGLPNETIEYKNNKLYVNGEYKTDPYAFGKTDDFTVTLGPDEYLCLGDNREVSYDSRYYGPFTDKEIFAKLTYKVYPKKQK